jgi:hypothetical protein
MLTYVIFKKLLFIQDLLSCIHHLPFTITIVWTYFFDFIIFWSEFTNASVKIALIDIYHTCQSRLCNHTMHLHLPQTEKRWLLENTKLYKGYERKVKSDIKKKLKIFKSLNYHISKKRITWLSNVTEYRNNVTKFSNSHNNNLPKSNFNIIDNFQTDSTKNLQYTDHNYKIYGGPDVIRTRDPRHVKAVS